LLDRKETLSSVMIKKHWEEKKNASTPVSGGRGQSLARMKGKGRRISRQCRWGGIGSRERGSSSRGGPLRLLKKKKGSSVFGKGRKRAGGGGKKKGHFCRTWHADKKGVGEFGRIGEGRGGRCRPKLEKKSSAEKRKKTRLSCLRKKKKKG